MKRMLWKSSLNFRNEAKKRVKNSVFNIMYIIDIKEFRNNNAKVRSFRTSKNGIIGNERLIKVSKFYF